MNPKLIELFDLFKNLRNMQVIVEEILTLDYYVYNFDKDGAARTIDFVVGKYEKEINQIGALHKDKSKNMVVVDEPTLYEEKDEVEVNSDCEYVRDCLIMIGAVKSGIRRDLQQVLEEIEG